MDYTHVNDGEVPTTPEPATLPPTDPSTDNPTTVTSPSSATNPTNSTNPAGVKSGNDNSGKGVVATAEGTVAAMLGTVLVAAVAVAFVARKRRESEEA